MTVAWWVLVLAGILDDSLLVVAIGLCGLLGWWPLF